MSLDIIYIDTAVAAQVHSILTYAAPAASREQLQPGMAVLVPLGRRRVTAFVLAVADAPPAGFDPGKIRPLGEILHDEPLFPAAMIPFFRWIAEYYGCPPGEVIKSALPGGITSQSRRELVLTPEGQEALARRDPSFDEAPPAMVEELAARGQLTPAMTTKILRQAPLKKMVQKWLTHGLVTYRDLLVSGGTREKKETCVELIEAPAALPPSGPSAGRSCAIPGARDTPDVLSVAPSTSLPPLGVAERRCLDVLRELVQGRAEPRVARAEVTRRYSGAGKALQALAAKGLIRITAQPVYRDPFGEMPPFFPPPAELTTEQSVAVSELRTAVAQKTYSVFLLHGVTGSGKTEVYLQAAAATLASGRSVLVLVPEIALATQLEGHFLSRFGAETAILHSGLSSGERFDQWLRILRGQARIVIGARSAIFAPLSSPGLIIVDEEHDAAYKQDDHLHYHGRDLAVLRASQQGAVVILGSATPSVGSYHHARQGKYRLLELTRRIQDRPMPQVTLIDLKKEAPEGKRPPLFSQALLAALAENCDLGQQSLIFLNRRGFANLMLCRDCGHTIGCPHCQVTLTFHKGRKELICHYCGHASRSDIICSQCRSMNLLPLGFGTERVEEELHQLFPRARILRLDRDSATSRDDYITILRQVHRGEVDILVGTQMIAKGHHFPNVTLVGVVWADGGLGMPDFRAGERTFQLLAQVTGRAGRGELPGRVIIQTFQPEHYSIICACNHDYQGFFAEETGRRRPLGFPPFSRLINLCISGDREESVKASATTIAQWARELAAGDHSVLVRGPAPAPLSRLRGRYRWQLLLQGSASDKLRRFCGLLMERCHPLKGKDGLTITVDVDPENMM